MTLRTTPRRVAVEYLSDCDANGYRPTLDEIVEVAVSGTNHLTIDGVVDAYHRYARAEVADLLRRSDSDTRLRLRLPVIVEGQTRWFPHSDMRLAELTNSARYVTRPQMVKQVKAERRREIERQVIADLERRWGREVTPEEAWPEVELALQGEGLL